MHRLVSYALLLFCSSLPLGACDNSTPTPTSPTPAPPAAVTETFAGELNRNGAATHTFLAQASGTVTATLDTLAPENTPAIGLSLGTWNGSACQIVIANDNAARGAIVVGAASSAGNLCVRVYDVGKVGDLASYQLTVVHP